MSRPSPSLPVALRILAIPGSLRTQSLNRLVAESLQGLAPEHMMIEVYEQAGELPLYNEDFDGADLPPTVLTLRQNVIAADALVWCTPEFNHTIPAVVKNLIEWISHPVSHACLVGKISAIAVATQGRGGYRGMADLARVLRDLGGHVVVAPEVCIQLAHTSLRRDTDGRATLGDPVAERLLRLLLRSLDRAVRHEVGAHAAEPWRTIFAQAEPG